MSVAACLWRRQFSFLPSWSKPPFLVVFCFFFALHPRLAVLSGPAPVSPHNSLPSYWNLGGEAAARLPVWFVVRRPERHGQRCCPVKAVLYIWVAPTRFPSGCGIRIVRHLAGLHVRRLRYQLARLFARRTALMHEGVAVPSTRALVFPLVPFVPFFHPLTAPRAPPSSLGSLNPGGGGLPSHAQCFSSLVCQS